MGSSSSRILAATQQCHGHQRDSHASSSRNPHVLHPNRPADPLLENYYAPERHQNGHVGDTQSPGNSRGRWQPPSVNTANHSTECRDDGFSGQYQPSAHFSAINNGNAVLGNGLPPEGFDSESRGLMEGIVVGTEISGQTFSSSNQDINPHTSQQPQRNTYDSPAIYDDDSLSDGIRTRSFGLNIVGEITDNTISSENSRGDSDEFMSPVYDRRTSHSRSGDLSGPSMSASAQVAWPAFTESVEDNVVNQDISHVEVPVANLPSEEMPSLARGRHMEREVRRNTGRRFWDALTRAASHRRSSNPITIVAIEEIDEHGSSSRWNLQQWRAGSEDEHSAADGGDLALGRTSDFEERRRRVRSQVWALQRLSSGLEGLPVHSRNCPAGGQPGGSCSCEGRSLAEDTTTRASISRIIMLAEALFEVLDEIHRQSFNLSRSATVSLSSLPAPDSVVDSFPVRIHKKMDDIRNASDEVPQCYICLVEYEEGDQVRVLPCHHDYHKGCVDKWLKEVHRVCPLCRGNVCEAS